MQQVVGGPAPSLPAEGFTDEFRDFISLCCKKKAEERPKYVDLLKHPFISRFHDAPLDISQFAISVIDG
ncbi:hypothetical protein RvY_09182-2 [Ramazzottius varieornatus]|uniref:Protein kinase domain-containing protein n=1 Tax=Ramazzottius varieornatus TaxID=947166 RepID=A0A1D1VHK2_RAMVA|nr:hypothetical protein RvY_09182-2 [Ramazzottius varieornatus]